MTEARWQLKEFKIEHGETVLDAISRVTKNRGILLTDNAQGELVLCGQAKTKPAARFCAVKT